MVDGEQHAARWDRFFHVDLGRQPGKPQKGARHVVDRLMAPTPARQEENGGPDYAGACDQQRPPVACVDKVEDPVPKTAGAMAKPGRWPKPGKESLARCHHG